MLTEQEKSCLKDQSILFIHAYMGLGGTENVILQLCESFRPLVKKIVVVSLGGVNVEKLEAMGIKHYTIPLLTKKDPKTILTVCRTLRRIVKEEQITLIHAHHRMAAFYVHLLGLQKKRGFFCTAHNTFTDKQRLTRFAYEKAHMIACGEMVKKNLVDFYHLPENQVTVIRNAVTRCKETITPDPLIKELHQNGRYIIASFGRLGIQKGFCYFLQAIPAIIAKHPEAHFLIVGWGELETELHQLSETLHITDHVTFTGYREDARSLMSQVDLTALTSLWEGLPLTAIEAFAARKTIVATAVDGTPELVTDKENGLLIPPKSPEAIANAILWMMDHPEEKARMEQAAFTRYEEGFTIEKFIDGYASCYTKIMK